MSDPGEEGALIWGIDAGSDTIEAVQMARRAEGGFHLLDHVEVPVKGPAPQALVSFLRQRRILRHPLVIAIRSASSRVGTVTVQPDRRTTVVEDTRLTCLDYIHPEPEFVDLRYRPVNADTHLMCAEDRSLVESYLIALEGAETPAYALVSTLDALTSLVTDTTVHDGDAVVVRVRPHWTDIVFLDGIRVRHLGLAVGARDLEDEDGREVFAADFTRYLEYHRSLVVEREEPERILLLGLPASRFEEIAPLLPERPLAFPADADPIRGKGKIATMRGLEIVRECPDAVGAAIAGAAEPRRLELAFRRLPTSLPTPPRPVGTWIAATVLLWVALVIAWGGTARETGTLRNTLSGLGVQPDLAEVRPQTLENLKTLISAGRDHAGFAAAVSDLFALAPEEEAAPCGVEELTIRMVSPGVFEVVLVVAVPEARGGPDSPLAQRLSGIGVEDIEWETGDGRSRVRAVWRKKVRR